MIKGQNEANATLGRFFEEANLSPVRRGRSEFRLFVQFLRWHCNANGECRRIATERKQGALLSGYIYKGCVKDYLLQSLMSFLVKADALEDTFQLAQRRKTPSDTDDAA